MTSSGKVKLWAHRNTGITIGKNCMLAGNIEITTGDFHSIFDIANKKLVNPNKSISIGCNVWLAKNCTILKGVNIGNGSVVGNGAIVTKDIPSNCIAAGVPARVIKKNIVWDRRSILLADDDVNFNQQQCIFEKKTKKLSLLLIFQKLFSIVKNLYII